MRTFIGLSTIECKYADGEKCRANRILKDAPYRDHPMVSAAINEATIVAQYKNAVGTYAGIYFYPNFAVAIVVWRRNKILVLLLLV